MMYALYALSVPFFLTTVAFLVQTYRNYLPDALEPIAPTLGLYTCFFEERMYRRCLQLAIVLFPDLRKQHGGVLVVLHPPNGYPVGVQLGSLRKDDHVLL